MIAAPPAHKTGTLSDMTCPLCGDRLYEERGLVWCSHVAPGRGLSCDYGVNRDITLAEHHRRVRTAAVAGSLAAPDGTGFWVFDGIRHTASGRFLVTVRDLVEVRRVHVGAMTKLEVLMMGSATRYAADTFEGAWTRTAINFGGKRT